MAQILRCDPGGALLLERCSAVLAAGELAILPTDTVYGLAARADLPQAVEAVFAVKGRDTAKSLVVMVASLDEALGLAAREHRGPLRRLGTLWPGPLTLVVKAGHVPWAASVAPGASTLGVRVPDDAFLLRLLKMSGPLAVTSANTAGKRAPASFEEIEERLIDAVALAVDGGLRGSGRPSTVAGIKGVGVEVLRQGTITQEQLLRVLAEDKHDYRPAEHDARQRGRGRS